MPVTLSQEALQFIKEFPPGTYEKFESIEQQVKAHLLTLKIFLRGNKYTIDEVESKEMHFAIVNVFLSLRDEYYAQSKDIYSLNPVEMLQKMYKTTDSIDRLYKQFVKASQSAEAKWRKQEQDRTAFEEEQNAKNEAYLKALKKRE